MPYLAKTRAGVQAFLTAGNADRPLWIGSEVLSQAEIEGLRGQGYRLSVFVQALSLKNEIEAAVSTVEEHHPGETVWMEQARRDANPRSANVGQAFLWREWILGVKFQHNDLVELTAGEHKGAKGSLVALIAIAPEPIYLVELESGFDHEIGQAFIKHADKD